MKTSRYRRGISPVIAILLIIALVVAGAATVWLITNSLLNSDVNLEIVDVSNLSDFNNDSLIDALTFKVTNLGEGTTIGYVSIIDADGINEWYLAPGSNPKIDNLQDKSYTIFTNISSYQVSGGKSVTFALGPSKTERGLSSYKLSTKVEVPDPVTVSVTQNASLSLDAVTPVVGAQVYFTTGSGLPVDFPTTSTDSKGQVKAYLLPDYYVARTVSGQHSEVFHRLDVFYVNIGDISEFITVTVQDANANPLQGVSVYTQDSGFNDLGNVASTNSIGQVNFTLGKGSYFFRASYLGQDYYSSQVTIPLGLASPDIIIQIASGDIIGRAVFGDTGVGSGKLLRLYNRNNQSLGRYDYTNSSSHFEFIGGIPSGLYRLRLDYQNQRYWSPLISPSDAALTVDFGGGTLTVQLTAGGTPLRSGVLVRLYHADNSSTGRYDYLNGSGFAELGPAPSGTYRFRVDWLGQRFYTSSFSHVDSQPKSIDLGGGPLNVYLSAAGTPLRNGILARLYNEDGTNTGIYDYLNGSGVAEYGSVLPGTYKLRVDWLGQRFYSSPFVHDDKAPIFIDLGGGRLTIQITAGGTPLRNGVLARLYNGDGTNTGIYDYLNGTGHAEYGAILPGIYKLRVDWLGQRYYTATFNHSSGDAFVLDIGGGALNVQLTAGGTHLPNGVLARLYNSDGTNTGIYDYLNGTGYAEYGAILPGSYKIRIDWLGQRYYTSVFNHSTGNVIQALEISGGVLNVKITAGGDDLPSGVLIRLFNADGTNTGKYDYLNSSSVAEFGVILPGSYKVRIDWLNRRVYSSSFNHSSSLLQTVDLSGGDLSLAIEIGGTAIPNGVLVRLFNADGTNTGLYDYVFGGNGSISLQGILGGDYKLRLDWMGVRTYSANFTHDGTPQTLTIPGVANMKLTIDGLGSGVMVRLYWNTSGSTGRYAYTNSSGQVSFAPVPAGVYKIRLGSANYSDPFTAAPAVSVTFGLISSNSVHPLTFITGYQHGED